jgi:hypothetical protein
MKPKQRFLNGVDIALIVGIVVFGLAGVVYAIFSGVINVPGVTPVLQADVKPTPVAKKRVATTSPSPSASTATGAASPSSSPGASPSPSGSADPQAEAKSRDTTRKDNLATVQALLQQYFNKYKKYPPTNSGANFEKIDTALKVLVDTGFATALPFDPISGRFYMYQSDGKIYSLTAQLEDTSDPAGVNNSETPPKYLYTVKNP